MTDDFDMVAGLLLHLGGFEKAPYEMKKRVVESINPVMKEWGIWQAQDSVYGLSWIVVIGNDDVAQLVPQRTNGANWVPCPVAVKATICDINATNGHFVTASVMAFHDTRHAVAPPALLKIGDRYIYRNISGHAVPLDAPAAETMLGYNKVD